MNPHTGHLVANMEAVRALGDAYLALPAKLESEAKAALAGRTEVHIDLRGRTPLAEWAKKKRKAKIAAKSRRINRSR